MFRAGGTRCRASAEAAERTRRELKGASGRALGVPPGGEGGCFGLDGRHSLVRWRARLTGG